MRLLLTAASLLILSGSDALAQGINNPVDDVRNPAGALKRAMERRRLMQYAGIADAENERLRAAGQARINAGQASTTFQRTTGSIAPARKGAQAPNPADRQRVTEWYSEALRFFDNLATENKINRNDVADGMGLALTLAFQVYSGGQIATPEQRRAYTEATRQNLLHNAIFQSYSDEDRQFIYELHGMDAGRAGIYAGIGSQNRDEAQRNGAVQLARNTLADLWPYPVDGMELTSTGFEDRGVRLIREGKATTQFTPTPAPLVKDPQQLQLWRAFLQVAQAQKIPLNDVGTILGLCIIINWENAMGGQPLDRQHYLWTYAGMKRIVLTSPDWQRKSDADKESNVESWAIRTMASNAEMQQASRAMPEQLSGQMLQAARGMGVDQASLRAGKIKIAALHALMNLDAFFPPKFAEYTLDDNGFVLANAAAQR